MTTIIFLIKIYKRNTLDSEGADLSKIVTEHLLNSEKPCSIDFDSIIKVTDVFFQDFLFPLILEFGSETIKNKVRLIHLSDDHHLSYNAALLKSHSYLERVVSRYKNNFGDISDISCELLIKARELSRRDPSAAHVIFGLSSGMIECLAKMDIDQIRRISSSGVVCFEPRFTNEFASKLNALQADEIDMFLNVIGTVDMEGVYESEYY